MRNKLCLVWWRVMKLFSFVFLSLFLWPGTVLYLIIGVIVITTILMVLLRFMRKTTKKQLSKTNKHTLHNRASTIHINKYCPVCFQKLCQVVVCHKKMRKRWVSFSLILKPCGGLLACAGSLTETGYWKFPQTVWGSGIFFNSSNILFSFLTLMPFRTPLQSWAQRL